MIKHDEKYAGETAASKIQRIGAELAKISADSILTSKLDEVACKIE